MDIALDKVCELILRAKAIDVKEGITDPDSGSNPTDDASTDVLIDSGDDLTESEMRDVLAGLNDDERHDLIALVFVGRGDMEPEEWRDAVRLARERDDGRTADWLLGIPNLGDLWDEGLAALGKKTLMLSAEKTLGAHPYLTVPAHTRYARELFGSNVFLAPEHKVVLCEDPYRARAIGRSLVDDPYLGLRNYTNNLRLIAQSKSRQSRTKVAPSSSKSKFARPWAMFMVGGTPELIAYLIWYQTFAISKGLTFSVLKLEDDAQSWVLCNFTGDCVDPKNADEIMTVIKRTLWLDDAFRAYVFTALTHMGVPGNINDHAVYATETFTLTFFNNTDQYGQPATVVQLRGRPIPNSKGDCSDYVAFFRKIRFWVDMDLLKLAGKVVCQLCKAEIHPTYDCTFPQTEGWLGPENDGPAKHAEKVHTSVAKSRTPSSSTYPPKRRGSTTRRPSIMGL